ncbi:DDE-type integrase/transposase/recombinase [Saccharothrix sp. ST-888]|uniref:DDE-type integrase/transposase/recombinase n=1 Tax=Saccharothrix sp. ST-888 TaxID=1427391 RepID=UPI0006991EEC|nr:DDE-type integrase/transposase/recombinase [Saccharothrix sp. ST-888]
MRLHRAPPWDAAGRRHDLLPTEEGWRYLATAIDLATREVVGYAMADRHRAELLVAALRMAVGWGALQAGCIFQSDCGSEYPSTEFRNEISKLDMGPSMGRVGSCCDNAAVKSFFAVLKEETGIRIRPDRATARAEVFSFIEAFCSRYNRRRLRKHPEWGYPAPLEIR